MNLVELLAQQADSRGSVPALIAKQGKDNISMTFRELATATENAASLLVKAGLRAGDRILVLQPMSIELYVALLAILQSGMTAIFLDPSAGMEHIERCCQTGKPNALIASSKAHLLRLVSKELRHIRTKFHIGFPVPQSRRFSWAGMGGKGFPIHPVSDDTPGLLTFTTGSTGLPKAAVRSHGFLVAQHAVLERSLEILPGETDLATLPIFALANLASGITTLLPDADLRRPGFVKAEPIAAQIKIYCPNRSAASPAFYERLLDYYEKHSEEAQGCSLQKLYVGGAPVFPSLLNRLRKCFPASEPVAVYGSTEAEPIAHISLSQISENDLSSMHMGGGILAGLPVDEIQVRIGGDQEIQVCGRHVLSGYLNGEGDADTKIHEGDKIWHRTGDAGRFDISGRLWLLGRCSAKTSNEIYPLTVEAAAMFFPWVKRSGFVEVKGQRYLAIEIRGIEVDVPLLKTHLGWAGLAQIVVMKRIPVDPRHNAKVDYGKLRRMLDKEFVKSSVESRNHFSCAML